MMSRQTIKSYAAVNGKLAPELVEDYMGLKADVDALIEGISPQFGEGSPEGVVTSNLSKTYYDVTGGVAVMYVNPAESTSAGWIEVS